MVKILQTYNFTNQNIHSLNGDILAATLIDSSRIAVSSVDHCIEIYDIDTKQKGDSNKDQQPQNENIGNDFAPGGDDEDRLLAKQSLATVGEVVNLMYCESGKYLITLERENVSSPVQTNSSGISCTSSANNTVFSEDETKMFVRIYANFWKFPSNVKLNELPITIRIASMTTPKALVKSIDVIELPLRSPPDIIQCCQTSGNIIVSSKERIYLYEYTQCVHENTQPRFKYIDFLPFKFFVSLNFIPSKLNVAENVIACLNNRYCVAFRIVDVLASNACTAGTTDGVSSNTAVTTNNLKPNAYNDNCGKEKEDVHIGLPGDGGGTCGTLVSDSSGVSKSSALGRSSHCHNSFESDSLDTTSGNGRLNKRSNVRTTIDFNVARMVNSACGRDFEVHLKSQWDNLENDCNGVGVVQGCSAIGNGSSIVCSGKSIDGQEITINPTRANEIKIKLVNEAKAMNVQRVSGTGKIIAAYNEDNMVQYDVRKLLQICMKTTESGCKTGCNGSSGSGRVLDILRCMDLKALYQRCDSDSDELDDPEYDMGNQQVPGSITTSKHINRRTLKSPKHKSCIGFALIVTSSVDGYLYLFCAKGKWYNENEKPLAIYSFTAPVLYVHINDYVIYAVTTESVETHTSRLGHKLFNNRYEYSTLAAQYPEESSPDINDPIAVLGLSTFVHVQYVCVNRNNLVLITNGNNFNNNNNNNNNTQHHHHHHHHHQHHNCNQHSENDGGNACLMKKRHETNSSNNNEKRNIAARIIAEARAKHNLLRLNSSSYQPTSSINNEWTLYNLQIPQVENIVDDLDALAQTFRMTSPSQYFDLMQEAHVMLRMSMSLHIEQLQPDREIILYKKFVDNCHKLADFAVRSSKKEIYIQATGFYKMCNLQLPDIYKSYIKTNSLTNYTDEQKQKQQLEEENHEQHIQLSGLIYCVKEFLSNLGMQRLKASYLNQSVAPYFTPKHIVKQGYHQVPLALEFLHLFVKYSPADLPQIMLESPIVADCISGETINYLKQLKILTPDENLLYAVTACRMSNYMLSHEIVNRTTRHDLAIALIKYRNVLFDDSTPLFQGHSKRFSLQYYNTPIGTLSKDDKRNSYHSFHGCKDEIKSMKMTNHDVTSFSDFTETILLAIENKNLIEAISDAFIHAVCVEHTLTLDITLQLFLNFIGSHIGQKGYQTSQKVFVNILQVYYYDYFDVNPVIGAGDLISQITPQLNDQQNDNNDDNRLSKANSIEQDSESLMHSNSDSMSASSLSASTTHFGGDPCISINNRNNRIVYDQLQEQQAQCKRSGQGQSNVPLSHAENLASAAIDDRIHNETHKKGLKILFRMYMGRLKALSDLVNDLQSADIEQQSMNEDFISLRMECINFMMRHLQDMRKGNHQQQLYYTKTTVNVPGNATATNNQRINIVPYLPDYTIVDKDTFEQHIKLYRRPIPCLMERPQYLNRLPPFQRNDFTYPNVDEGDITVHFVGWHNELLTLTLKIQSLLASRKIDREIIEEFIAFVQKAPDLIGIDSFLIIILPRNMAINYMISLYPEYLWHYGKCNNFTPKQWESLLKKLINKKHILTNWKQHVTEILNNLVIDLSYEELLQCFPNEVIQNRNMALWSKELASECHATLASYANELKQNINEKYEDENGKDKYRSSCQSPIPRNHLPMDNVDENNVFELTLRKAVSKQRSIALRSMIESTGKQLFEATNNPMYNL